MIWETTNCHQGSSRRIDILTRCCCAFHIITDHTNLEYVKVAKRLNPYHAWWALFFRHCFFVFSGFSFTVTFRPGNKNSKADDLSRHHDPPPSVIIVPILWDLIKDIQWAQHTEPLSPECLPPANLDCLLFNKPS